ncbi:MAG: AraC family transcriptional regulator, partial [Chitinophagaceae bacterium]|nr:AraC family transcriptional regulator [Chitinophagaceae bacterium]
RAFLMSSGCKDILSLNDLSANFNSSPRTIQRRLKKENTTFQKLAEEVMTYFAKEALQKGDFATKEIAYMLGYNELSAFSRAFKRWTGQSPYAYRALPKVL